MWQKIKNIYHLFQSLAANIYYGFPGRKLTVIGVTGTSGKTSTTLMVYRILKDAGLKVSVLSTLKAVIGGSEYDTGFHVTTPDPHVLPKYLAQAVKNGDKYFVLEVSSHALDQNRVAFIPFKIGILTSFAHEHLDYHRSLANYAKAKFKLLHNSEIALIPYGVINQELQLAVNYEKLKSKVKTFGIKNGDETEDNWKLNIKLPGEYNLLNALAAAAATRIIGVGEKEIKSALSNFQGIPGRFEEVKNTRELRLFIDFAHKPDALEAVLQVAGRMVNKNEKVIVMFGCASERDFLKRPIMGEISGRLADITVLTDEDPRHEDPIKIINEIAAGCEQARATEMENGKWKMENLKHHVYFKIPDRQEAINFIINSLAKKGDVVLFCGKGHEQSMNYKGKELPWSEHQAVINALQKTKA